LKDLSIEDLKAACDLIDESVYDILGTHNAVAALQSFGSGGKAPVEEQLAYWQNRLLQ
jgi:argininosuccinate lyase